MIIGLMGAAGAGKSTAAEVFERYGYARRPFAGPLKEMLAVLGLTHAQLHGDEKEIPCDLLCGKTPRHAMQTLGTEWRETIGRELWSRIWVAQLAGHVVAEDVRFEHEHQVITNLGGYIVRIDRGDAVGDHVSEQAWRSLPAHFIVDNVGGLDVFQRKIQAIVMYVGGGAYVPKNGFRVC